MNSKIDFTKKLLNLVAKNRGIKNPQKMSTIKLLDTLMILNVK